MEKSFEHQNHLIIPATEKHTSTIIFIHGLGDSGYGYPKSIISIIRQPHVKYICPHATKNPTTLNRGWQIPSWFDIIALKLGAEMDTIGIKTAASKVHSWINDEIVATGLPSDRIGLGGFSQGAALAIYSTFTYDKPLAGLAGLSTWLLLPDEIPGQREENLQIPIFQTHGDSDHLVNLKMGEHCAKHIKQFDRNHTMKIYHGLDHATNSEELEDVKKFYEKILPPI